MTKILRDYIQEEARATGMTNSDLVQHVIKYLDNKFGEEIDFAAEDLIATKEIDALIAEATVDWINTENKSISTTT